MVRVGYYYLLGTNIEVGVRRVSKAGKFAVIAYRTGKDHYRMRGWKPKDKLSKAKRIKEIKVPCDILKKKSNFTKRGKLRSQIVGFALPGIQNPEVDLKKDLLIWGLIPASVKSYDEDKGVVTFNTTPVRKAHVDVLRNKPMPMPMFEKRDYPAENGYLTGSNLKVKMVLEEEQISLYRFGDTVAWLPNSLITTLPFRSHAYDKCVHIGTKFLHGYIKIVAFKVQGIEDVLFKLPAETRPCNWVAIEHIQNERKGEYKKDEKKAYIKNYSERIDSLKAII